MLENQDFIFSHFGSKKKQRKPAGREASVLYTHALEALLKEA